MVLKYIGNSDAYLATLNLVWYAANQIISIALYYYISPFAESTILYTHISQMLYEYDIQIYNNKYEWYFRMFSFMSFLACRWDPLMKNICKNSMNI